MNIPNIIKFANDRENILKWIRPDRKKAKKSILAMLNGGYKNIYHKDKNINKLLKNIENESKMLHECFYENDRRITDDKTVYNYLGKNFANILMDYEDKLLMTLYVYFNMKKIKMMTLIFDGLLLLPKQNINIFDIEKYLYEKTDIPMKISIKPFQDYYEKFGEVYVDMKSFKKRYKTICYKNYKVIHHNHAKRENDIIAYISNNCNLKIKNKKELVMLFHNAKSYAMLICKIYLVKLKILKLKHWVIIKTNLIEFRIPGKDYCLKIIDSLSFLQSNLDSLSKELDDDLKIITKKHYKDNFELINKKLENFPYDHLKTEKLLEENLPD